ncbi:glycoside hydrolase family 2 protein [Nannocystis radixulma]|uniref:Glycoside hydrolase family 2 TIM barrel-domain containing protein n=1 Tax=Nannocystis radixulma TaxID=2995305 RepID=A0ABT5BNY3_9BACT|nr:glycoside hydrolase family 2 TIM barrel-domain containing protein [Nannocystis radixulma]MDC0675280.1 glycoside hydrolase family 2 TIM barrel-domain containing protein [Nannocystis radixulma]
MTSPSTTTRGPICPRPLLRRADDTWVSLDGIWEFAVDRAALWMHPTEVAWTHKILVPFAPETERSGIGEKSYFAACWYRRTIDLPRTDAGERLFLRFGAVDYAATVWIDGVHVAVHEGGYTPFSIEIPPQLRAGGSVEVVVRALDDPHDLAKPRGKQDWQEHPHSIWYPRTTGIWQTVWLERVPAVHIAYLRWTSNLFRWEIGFSATIAGPVPPTVALRLRLSSRERLLAEDHYVCTHNEIHRRIPLSDPGIDDARNELLWCPGSPNLLDAEIELLAPDGRVVDALRSYTALRTISVNRDQILLNGRPIRLRMVLDQGYWPETGMTAPDVDALRRDVELVLAMGFNGVRKHQKIEDPRYHYWADRLGLLVWEEMPSAYRFNIRSVQALTHEWMQVLTRDSSHPCIVAWVPFNESWGVPNLPDNPFERHYVTALYHLTRTLDPNRPVVGNDGWESVATDIVGIHDYDCDPARMLRRYQAPNVRHNLYERERFGGRELVLGNFQEFVHPVVLSEFGGIALSPDRHTTWGYSRSNNAGELERRLHALFEVVRAQDILAGYCYTQFADTYQEANGLLHADRTPKVPLERIAVLNGLGPPTPHDDHGQQGQEV